MSAKTYVCPMHPEVRQEQPGRCPKCGMFLEPEETQRSCCASGHLECASHSAPVRVT